MTRRIVFVSRAHPLNISKYVTVYRGGREDADDINLKPGNYTGLVRFDFAANCYTTRLPTNDSLFTYDEEG